LDTPSYANIVAMRRVIITDIMQPHGSQWRRLTPIC